MMAILRITSPILFIGPTMSKVDVGGMAVEAEPSHQFPIVFLPCEIDVKGPSSWTCIYLMVILRCCLHFEAVEVRNKDKTKNF